MTTAPNAVTERLWKALDERHDELVQLVADLVHFRSVLGQEAEIQEFIANYLRESGMETDVWEIDESLKELDESGDSGVPFAGRPNVAATAKGSAGWRSLIMNGHIDVVSPEPLADWTHDPWAAEIVDGKMYGRGALDMKSGVAINMFLPRVLRDLGITLKGDLIVQSVIEEECTGNGALDASRRYTADAVVVTEPSNGEFTNAHVGVMWFRVLVSGRSAHAAWATRGVNAISKTVPIIQALEALDARMNETSHPAFADFDHPINLNIGVIQGGDWPSTVPGECELHCRLSYYPGRTVAEIRAEVEGAIQAVVDNDPWLRDNPPVITYDGFRTSGSTVSTDEPSVISLGEWHKTVTGEEMAMRSGTGVNDMRYFNFKGMPAGCYGASGEGAHAADEWLDLASLNRAAKVLGAFVLEWCGADES
ncbi:MAG: ArgE/DapE family deacylase [Thermomicrobiales bacterium]|nr:ArgE/DapE family deacylase [Thermomicrobiales bacterium]